MRSTITIITIIGILLLTYFNDVNAQTIQLGSGTTTTGTTTASPINVYWNRSYRSQIVYTAAELNAAGITSGKIIRMGFFIEESPFYDLPNFTIKMRHTTAINVSSHDVGALTTVYTNSSYSPTAGDFDMLLLDTPFEWNGTDNILIDICHEPTAGTNASGRIRYYSTSSGYRYYYAGTDACNNNTLYSSSNKPQIQMTFGGNIADDAATANISVASCVGNNPISATIFNFGNNEIANVDIHWTINGVAQTTVNHASTIDTIGGIGNYTASVALGTVNLASLGTSASIQVWTESPNGNADANTSNDTATIEIKAAMGGTYTIGGASPDFATIQAAADSLKNNGACANITFNLRSGIYTEQVLMEDFNNPNEYLVTFQSESGNQSDVTIQYNAPSSSLNYTIRLDELENVLFRNLTFRSLNTNNNQVFNITNNASSIAFRNCHFAAPYVSYDPLVNMSSNNSENFQFYDCSFYSGGQGIYYNPSSVGDTIIIERDTFLNQYYSAIQLYDISYLRVNNNYISGDGSNYSSYYGMYIYNCDEYVSIYNNRIYNIKGNSGINLWYCAGNIGGEVYNNFIHTKGIHSTYGIYPYSCSNFNYDNNTIQCHSTGSNSSSIYILYGSGNNVRNNNCYNSNNGYAIYTNNATYISTSNYNNWYTSGTANTGYIGGTTYATLNDWINGTMLDSNSVAANPYFNHDSSYIVNQTFLNGTATPLSILTDIEGNARNGATPDIGAYEFTPMGVDAAIATIITPAKPFGTGIYDVKAILQNAGGTTLTSVDINWTANNIVQSTVNWTGSLASGDTTTVTLGSINFGVNQGYNFQVNTTSPNSGVDAFLGNDTAWVSDIYGALSGTYTVGGVLPDFETFDSLATQLNLGGVVGATIFSVRNGTYTEQITLNEICGADSIKTITFESESGDASLCRLEYGSASSSANYVVYLNGTDWLRFRNMSFANNSPTYRRIFSIDNEAKHLTFTGNHFSNTATNTTSNASALMYYSNDVNEYQSYQNNVFENGSYGLYLNGSYNNANYLQGNSIIGNQFTNQYYTGLYVYYSAQLVIDSNIVKTNSTYTNYYGLWLLSCENGIQVTQNQVINSTSGYGIYLNDCDGTSSNHNLVANNFIKMAGTSNSHYNLYAYYSNYTDIYNNSFNSLNTGATSRTVYINQGSNIQYVNNISRNVNGYPIYISNTTSVTTLDYNNYYTTGVNVGYWGSSAITSFADWQTNTSMEANSIFEDPIFLTDSTFNIGNSSLNEAGTPLASVSNDIENEPRNGTTPDIGADEFMLVGTDAGIAFVTPPTAPFTPTSHSVTANLKNFGADTLFLATIYWTVDGVLQAPVNWVGSVASGDTTTVTLGAYTFNNKVNYSIQAFTSMPNGIVDNVFLNDTASVSDVVAAFTGSYTLGGVTPDFISFNDAAYWLGLGGVIANVNIGVRSGTYTEQVSFTPIPGADTTNQVVIYSESADSSMVTLEHNSGSTNNYVLKFGGADWLTFQGMTIQTLNTTYARAIVLDSNSRHITIQNCELQGASASTSNHRALIYNYDNNNRGFNASYLTIRNNRFVDGSYGVYLSGYNSANVGTSPIISNNTFINQYYYGIYASNQENLLISDNYISTTSNYQYGYAGIYLNDLRNGYQVLNNQISGTTSGYPYGIYIYDCDGTLGNPAIVANNFVQVGGNSSSSYACNIQYSDYLYFYHNSVNSTNASSTSSALYYYYNQNSNFYNNIFAHTGGGYAIYYGYSTATGDYDYNNLYTTGLNIGYYSGARATLADWQAASSKETNSISIDPVFADSADLHVSAIALDKAGTATLEVTTDIDGESRNPATPDLGADEFSTDPDDAGLAAIVGPTKAFPSGSNPVLVKILNNGTNNLDSVRVNWTVNGILQPTYYHTTTVNSGGMQDSVNIGSYNFLHDTAHHLVIWTSHPNGNADSDNSNDTSMVQNLYSGLSGIYTIGGVTPDYSTFAEAITALERGGVVGQTVFNVRSGTYTEQIEIDEICGTSSINQITFTSESGDSTDVILTYSANFTNRYTLRLNGADWLNFSWMTIQGTNSSYARVIEIQNGSFSNTFNNNVLEGVSTASQTSNHSNVFTSNGTLNGNNTYQNNRFVNGSYGIYQEGHYNSGNYEQGTTISNNQFINQNYRAIYLYRQNAFNLSQNTITASTTTSNYTAIYLTTCSQGYVISKNNIYGIINGSGLYITSSSGTSSNRATVSNNFISIGEGSSTNNYGYYSYFSNYLNIYHNNIRNGSSNAAAKGFQIYGGNNVNLQNNIFANEGGGFAIYNTSSNPFGTSDYNDLFTSGANIGYWSGSNTASLADWQVASAHDANSISIDPSFTSASDLHVSQNALDSAATVILTITDDIDGDARSATHPDIGADEFGAAATNDIGVASFSGLSNACSFTIVEPVTVNITNFGSSTVTGFDVTIVVNDTIVVTENVGALSIAGGNTSPYTFVATFDFSIEGVHSVRAFTTMIGDANTSNDTASTTVENYANPNITFSPVSASVCEGSSINVFAFGGNTYQWNVVSTGNRITVSPLATTTYYVTVTNSNSCVSTDSIEVIVNPLPVASAINTGAYCDGETIQLLAFGGVNYSWAGPNAYTSTSANPTISNAVNLHSGTYYVTVTDGAGCSDSASTVVAVNTCNEICNNGIDDDMDGKTDCEDEECFDHPVSFSVLGSIPFCIGDSVTLMATGGGTYLWNTGATSDSIRVGAAATYSVTITATGGCDTTFSVPITINSQPIATASSGSPYCITDNIQLSAGGGVSYSWTGSNGFTSNIQNPTRNNATLADAGIYTVIVTDANGCKDTASTTVAVSQCLEICNNGIDDDFDGKIDCDDTDCHDAISLVAQSATTFCIGDSVILKASNGQSYLWSTTSTADSIIVYSSGVYSVQITSSSGCDSTMSIAVTVNSQPTAVASNGGPYCIGGDIALNGSGGSSYSWTGPNGFTSSTEDPMNLNSVAADFGVYTLVVTNGNGCKDTTTTTVSNTGNTAPTLTYTGNLNFANSIVSPTQGDPYTTFRFEVTYTDADGDAPAVNEPQVWMDAENNGSYFNTNDRVLFMQELDPTDLDVTDGKIYYFETIGLPISATWDSEIRASDGNGCDAVFGGFDAPDVLNATDISIFANDIVFSDMNPSPGDTITISTTIHNYSNFDATNFVVRLLNQNDSLYQDDTVAVVPALGQITLQWQWITSDTPSWNPMQVILDLANTINEPNELDNTALRPFTNGNFVIGGDIITTASASPNPTYAQRWISLSGNAVYTDLAVTLADSSVAGATVTFNIYDSTGTKVGGPYSTYTNSLGNFSKSFYQNLFAPATYTIRGNTTDFTLIDTFTTTFTLITPPPAACSPDLRVSITLSDYKFPTGTTITGTATVYNNGCDTADASQLFIELPAGTPVPGPFSIPLLLPNASYTVNLGNMTFNTIGQTYIKGYADYGNVVAESNEFNNTYTRNITVLPASPDIVAKSYSFPSVSYACDTACFSFLIGNDGGVDAGAFQVALSVLKDGVHETTYMQTVDTLVACTNKWLTFCHLLSDPNATYTFALFADSTNVITEYREDNNRLSTNRTSNNCLPDLQVVECRWSDNRIEVLPVDPSSPGNVGLRAEIYNGGNLDATNFDVKFLVINTSIPDTNTYTVNYSGTLAGGARDTVSIYNIPNIAFGNHDLVVIVDPDDVINERYENNNTEEVDFCYEFNLARHCYSAMWWDYTHTVFNPVQMGIRVKNDGVFDASSVDVKFEVSGPGIVGWQLIDQGTQTPAYSTACNCNYGFVLPTPYAFQQAGTYQVRMTVDPDNNYTECNENNNVMIVDVNVVQVPDMRVLSQHINPSLLNPEPNQNVTFDVTYENIGVSNVGDSMELFIMVDEIPLDSMRVGGLTNGDFNTVNFSTPWSSNLVGAHVARIIIDNDEEISEGNELNNEATRALHVGQLPDLYPTDFCLTAANPTLYSAALLEARIHNSGDTSCNADVQFYYVDANWDTILIATQSIFVPALDSIDITEPWNNVYTPTTLFLRIVNANPEEARTDNNEAHCFIGSISVTINKDRDADCQQEGQATATVQGGTGPYTFLWSDGDNTNILTAPSGGYTLTVTDVNGLQATGQVTINQTSSLTASYSLQDTCSPAQLFLAADKGANSYTWSGPNGFTGYDSDTTFTAYTTHTGVYSVTADYGNNCTETATVYVEIDTCCRDTFYINNYYCVALVSYPPITQVYNLSNGCDSVVITNWTYTPNQSRNDTITICQGDSVIVGSSIYKTTGNYSDTLSQVLSSCDSVINTFLTVVPMSIVNQSVEICQGDSVIIGVNVYSTTGIYTDTLQKIGTNCDSIVTINLTVKPIATSTTSVELCEGATYNVLNGNGLLVSSYNMTGSYSDTLINGAANGCDSIVITTLTVKPNAFYNNDHVICEGDSIIVGTNIYKIPNTYTDTLQGAAANGCDSIVTITLSYHGLDTTYLTAQTCNPAQVGTTNQTFQNQNGCDSLVITTTTLVNTVRDTIIANICNGGIYQVGTSTYQSTGVYSDTLSSSSSCDSIVTLNLTVHSPILQTVNLEDCNPANVGTVIDTLQNQYSCDSLIRTTITTLKPSYAIAIDTMICQGESVIIDNVTYDTSGIYTISLGATNDCDSIITLTLTVKPNAFYNNDHVICEGDSIIVGTNIYKIPNTYTDTLQGAAANGCDSIVTITLSYHGLDTTYLTAQTCNPAQVGTTNQTFQNQNGCDSLVITTTTLVNTVRDTIIANICNGGIYQVGTSTYQSTGVYSDTLSSSSSCDSIVTLNLTVHSPILQTVNLEDCNPANVGTVIDTLQSQYSCDSLIRTTITTLKPSSTTYLTQVSCFPTDTGTVTQNLMNIGGCDSLVIITTTLLPSHVTYLYDTTCNSSQQDTTHQHFTSFNGCDSLLITTWTYEPDTFYTMATTCDTSLVGTSVSTTQGNNCTEVYIHTITLLPTPVTTIDTTICSGQNLEVFFMIGTTPNVYSQTGTYTDVLTGQAINGCDSIVIHNLTVLPADTTYLMDTTCNPVQPDITSQLFTTIGGCDSVVITTWTYEPDTFYTMATTCDTNLVGTSVSTTQGNNCTEVYIHTITLLPTPVTTIDTTICSGQNLEVFFMIGTTPNVYSQTGTYTDVLTGQAINGCDSIVIHNLTVLPADTTYLMDTTCNPVQPDITSQLFTTIGGCDSVVITTWAYEPDTFYTMATTCDTNLVGTSVSTTQGNNCTEVYIHTITLLPTPVTTIDTTICSGQNLEVFFMIGTTPNVYSQTGIYTDVLTGQAINGCDSIVIHNLTVLPADTTYLMDTTCNPVQPDITSQLFTTIGGCDSVVITTWTYEPDTFYTMATTCDTNLVGTSVSTTQGNNCTEVYIHTITLLPTPVTTIDTTICSGQNLEVFFMIGTTPNVYSQTGTYTDVLTGQAINGCDSIVIHNLTVLPADTTYLMDTTCNPVQPDITSQLFTTIGGCDSVVITTWAYEPDTFYTMATTCDTNLVGTSVSTTQGNNCTEVYIHTITLLPTPVTTIDTTICSGQNLEVFFMIGTTPNVYSQTGIYTDVLTGQAMNGCDSIVIHNLTVLEPDTFYVQSETCHPQSAGTFTENYITNAGCDSVVITIVNYVPLATVVIDTTICSGQTYYISGGEIHDSTGTYVDTLSGFGIGGCDSVVITNLTVLPADTFYVQSETCHPQSAGTFTENYITNAGCDSVVITIVNYVPLATVVIDTTICSGQTYYISGGEIHDSTGTYVDTLSGFGVGGCDSVVITNLTVLEPDTFYVQSETCHPQSAGTFTENYITNAGCDSVVITIVNYVPLATVVIDTTICSGQTYYISGGEIHDSTGTYVDTLSGFGVGGCDSVVITNLTVLEPDTFYVSLTTCDSSQVGVSVNDYISSTGCDSIVVTTINLIPAVINVVDTAICEGSTYFVFDPSGPTPVGYTMAGTYTDILQGQAANGCDSIVISNLTIIPIDTQYVAIQTCDSSQVGVFTEILTNQAGCDSVVITTVTAHLNPMAMVSSDVAICENDSTQLQASGGVSYSWLPMTGLSNPNIANPMASPTATTIYTVFVTNSFGCVDSAQVTVTVNTPPVVTIVETASIICNGNTNGVLQANVTGGTTPLTYHWNDNSMSNTIGNLSIGFYTVTVTDGNGCSDSASYTLTQPNLMKVDTIISTPPNCNQFDGIITPQISGGIEPYNYNWSNGDTTATIDNLGAGIFDLTVTDANGCMISTSVTLSEVNVPKVNSTIQNVNCSGDSTGSITITMTDGTAPFTYLWDDGDTTSMRSNLFTGYYFLTVTDANGCHVIHSDTVTSPTPIQLMFQQVTPTCYDSTGSLTALPSGGIPPYSYLWNTGDSTQVINNLPQGYYSVTVTDGNGCTKESSQLFLNSGLPIADFSVTIADGTVIFDNNSINVINHIWNFGNGGTSSQVEPTVTYDTSGSYVITLIVTNNCGSDTITGTVTVTVTDINTVLAENVKAVIVPNPNRGRFRLDVKDLPIGEWQLEIYSITGQLMQSEIRSIYQSNTQIPIEMRDVGAGMYLLRMVNAEGVVITRKFIVSDDE